MALSGLLRRLVGQIPAIERRLLSRRSYSQEGEDLVLARHFGEQQRGFFVDVGAHHPFRFSNTQLFYERGWRGINIDAQPGSMRAFRRYRPHDINLEAGVGEQAGTARFFVFNEGLLNTFDEEIARLRDAPPFRIIETIEVPVQPLAAILEEHLPPGTVIDLLSVDAENRDLEVLRSNDWSRFRPRAVLVEVYGRNLAELAVEPISTFLAGLGYVPLAKTVKTVLFIDPAHPSQGV